MFTHTTALTKLNDYMVKEMKGLSGSENILVQEREEKLSPSSSESPAVSFQQREKTNISQIVA